MQYIVYLRTHLFIYLKLVTFLQAFLFKYSLNYVPIYLLILWLRYEHNQLFLYWLAHSLTHSLTHLLTY